MAAPREQQSIVGSRPRNVAAARLLVQNSRWSGEDSVVTSVRMSRGDARKAAASQIVSLSSKQAGTPAELGLMLEDEGRPKLLRKLSEANQYIRHLRHELLPLLAVERLPFFSSLGLHCVKLVVGHSSFLLFSLRYLTLSTLDAIMTDPADEQTHHCSRTDLATIGDLVVWHQMPFLSVRRLTQLNCPRWSMWDSYNVTRIAKARTLDVTRDWYFPIIVKKDKRVTEKALPTLWSLSDKLEVDLSSLPVKDVWSSWSGIWHSSTQHASEKALPLPPMKHLPHEWLHSSNPRDDIIASAGGLLLIMGMSGVVPIRRSKRLNPVLADSNPSSISDTTKLAAGTSNARIRNRTPQYWKRLLVCNPLTRQCKELPAANCRLLGLVSWKVAYDKGMQAHLVVNEEANCYQVILTLSDFVAVYTSTTNSWNCLRFPQERPWGQRISRLFVEWDYICTSAHVGGRLYFADVQSTTPLNRFMEPNEKAMNVGTLRLFEVNAEAGNWQVVQQYTLRKFHIPSLKYDDEEFFYDKSIIPYIEILECMGGLYAVLPAKVHDAWLIGEEQPHDWKSESLEIVDEFGRTLVSMPLCFYIMQLQGHGVDCGVLRIQVPLNQIDYQSRVLRLMSIANQEIWLLRNFFSCEAQGNVIWVACEDYVLSFDMVSRESKTQIIPLDGSTIIEFQKEKLRFAYRPSLHMKP